eukprot:gene12865-biopygen8606
MQQIEHKVDVRPLIQAAVRIVIEAVEGILHGLTCEQRGALRWRQALLAGCVGSGDGDGNSPSQQAAGGTLVVSTVFIENLNLSGGEALCTRSTGNSKRGTSARRFECFWWYSSRFRISSSSSSWPPTRAMEPRSRRSSSRCSALA